MSVEFDMSERLSIVIPARDEAAVITETLGRLQPMRQRGHEIILVDGGSVDETMQLASPLVDQLLCVPAGRANQLAAGVAVARYPIVWMLHADTQAPEDADHSILHSLQAAGALWGRFDVRLSGRHRLLRWVERLMNGRSCLTGICTGDQGIFVDRQTLRDLGGIPQLPLMEDIAMSQRLKRVGRPACVRIPLVTSSRRWEQRGVVRTILLMWCLRAAYALGVAPHRLARWYA